MRFLVFVAGGALTMLAATSGCGGSDDVPPNAVAKVGDTVISTADFDKRFDSAVKGQAQGAKPMVYEPPDFDQCVARKQGQNSAPEGQKAKSEGALRKECAQDYDGLRTETMEYLIQQDWVRHEADRTGVEVKPAEVRARFEAQKDQVFKTPAEYKAYLQSTGRTEQELIDGVRISLIQEEIAKKATAGKVQVSGPEIQGYFVKNKKQFGKPARRSLRLVIAKTEAQANEAKQAVAAGQSWATVAKKYSIDKGTAKDGGRLAEVSTLGYKEIDSRLRNARVGTTFGPVKSQFGWWVVEVDKVFPPVVAKLEDVRAQIAATLKQQQQQHALDEFAASFRERYRATTVCADDYKVASCKNGPEKNPTTPAKTMQPPQSQQSN